MKTKLLISGSAGFIFSNMVRKIVYEHKDKYELYSIDRVSYQTNALYWNKNHTFFPADITDAHIIDIIFQQTQPEIVIHGAAESFVDTSITNPNTFINSNVLGTQIMINASLKHKVKKFIYISTDEYYGQLENETDPPWTEDAPPNPRNPYSASKCAGEMLVKAAHATHGLTYNITRSSNNYGARQFHEKLIPKTIKHILENKNIPVYGQGKQIRDWLHCSDNISAIIKIMENGEPNQTYNISANQEFSNIEVVQEICNYMKKGWNLIEFIKDRPGHDFRYSIDASKLKKIGWKPEMNFKRDLGTECIDWYLNNQYWFR